MSRGVRVAWVSVSAIVLAGAAAWWSGCGDDDGAAVTFQGNVVDVVKTAALPPEPERLLARMPGVDGFVRWVLPSAVAQGAGCAADVEDVLACALSVVDEDGDQELDCEELRVNCARVNSDTCEFGVSIRISDEERDVTIPIFVQDEDGDGRANPGEPCGEGEPSATFTFTGSGGGIEEPFDPTGLCNGDVVALRDVALDFVTETAEAREVEKEIDACPPVTPTGTPPTATPTGATATPTRTPTGPTATPTRTSTPGGPTATPTPTAGGPTATPTATATSAGPTATPAATPTATPCSGTLEECVDSTQCCDGVSCILSLCMPF